jgi:hypothetical protein
MVAGGEAIQARCAIVPDQAVDALETTQARAPIGVGGDASVICRLQALTLVLTRVRQALVDVDDARKSLRSSRARPAIISDEARSTDALEEPEGHGFGSI